MEDENKLLGSNSLNLEAFDDSEDDNSDHNLHIDLGSPTRKRSPPKPTRSEQIIIESIEDEIEKQLTEKAEKTNLNAMNVKNLIRQVVTNEHVLALLKKAENPDENDISLPAYEPKLTRAKAKELLSSTSSTPLPWMTPKPSETHVLVSEDLQEDSSGDEYIPCGDEESEDDNNSSIASESDIPSIPPATPPTPIPTEDSSTQTNWTDDGVFKIPLTKSKSEQDEAAIIALRTRSKINLTSTPLEVIEKSFIPPDITTDMYDMDCDDDDWTDFLKGFTQPLDEIVRGNEDEDQDPEYNVLADGGIDKIDKEELRMDKAVKITRKEVKELWEELFEYIEKCSEDIDESNVEQQSLVPQIVENVNETYKGDGKSLIKESNKAVNEGGVQENVVVSSVPAATHESIEPRTKPSSSGVTMEDKQILLVFQQMQQHVQLVTQNFILTYNHPEYHEDSKVYKEYLINLNLLAKDKVVSAFKSVNLPAAIHLVNYWEHLLASNQQAREQTRNHTERCLVEAMQKKQSGSYNYVMTFPHLVLQTISNSDVFMYPSLLPKVPFKPRDFYSKVKTFTEFEDRLIALGLQEFENFIKEENPKKNLNQNGQVKLDVLASYISRYMMPHVDPKVLQSHIRNMKHPRCASNPIRTYFQSRRKIEPFLHYIFPNYISLPPCKQKPEDLPQQWREYIYGSRNISLNYSFVTSTVTTPCINYVNYPSIAVKTATVRTTRAGTTNTSTPKNYSLLTSAIPTPYINHVNCPNIEVKTSKPRTTRARTTNTRTRKARTAKVAQNPEVANINIPNSEEFDNTLLHLGQFILPKTNLFTSTPVSRIVVDVKKKRESRSPRLKRRNLTGRTNTVNTSNNLQETSLTKFINCLIRPAALRKLLWLFCDANELLNSSENIDLKESFSRYQQLRKDKENNEPSAMFPSMPALSTPVKNNVDTDDSENVVSTTTQEARVSSSMDTVAVVTGITEIKKNSNFDFSAISSSSFQQPASSSKAEFSKPYTSFQTFTSSAGEKGYHSPNAFFSQCSSTSTFFEVPGRTSSKDSLEDINALMVASSTVKPPAAKKEPSGAEKKRAKIRREFLANLTMASPEDPVAEKHKNAMFAMAYYDKMRETLELEDYHKVMQILNEYESGDAVDLYKSIEPILSPKYQELADEFILFLRETEAAAVGKLIPWIRMNMRTKFLRKLELYFKDQPVQLTKIYKCLSELSQNVDTSVDKIKSTILSMIKGNVVLTELFLQNFLSERPPLSLLEGPYEVMDLNKEMARLDNEEPVETIVVPDSEDKYGGLSCICQCHKIEDPEFNSRFRHCRKCGIKFYQGRVYMQTGQGLRPANISFDVSPNQNHSVRLSTKSVANANHRKKRSESSPSKQVITTAKEHIEDETEDEVDGKKKSKTRARSPRKSKKIPDKLKEPIKPTPIKKSVGGHLSDSLGSPKTPKIRKRTYSGRKPKKVDKKSSKDNKVEIDEKLVAIESGVDHKLDEDVEPNEDMQGESTADEFADCDFNGSGESAEKAPTSPEQNTAESESEFCEESSQDNCEWHSSSAESVTSDSNMNDEPWQRDEDKIILETFQQEDDKECAFQSISEKLSNRSIRQIRSRFSTLMDLLIEQIGSS